MLARPIGPTGERESSRTPTFETGIVFHRMGQRPNTGCFSTENAVTVVSSAERGRALELPFLAKYRFRAEHDAWRPFVPAGPTVRRTSLDARHLSWWS